MENPSAIALSMQMGLRRQMETIANNLANVSTPGFRGDRMIFATMLAKMPGGSGEPGGGINFVNAPNSFVDTRQGELTRTGNALDLAIQGDGYFVVETPGGPRYTRGGAFRLDGEGKIITPDGLALVGAGDKPIAIPTGAAGIEVLRDGRVMTETGEVGRLKVVKFENEQALQRLGGGLYDSEEDSQPVDAETRVQQGMIEGSNVQAVIEISNMIEVMRRYESIQRVMESEHERSRQAIDKLTRMS